MKSYAFVVVGLLGLLGCPKAGKGRDSVELPPIPPPVSQETPATKPPPTIPPAPVTVEMTAATLADDCGDAEPSPPSKADLKNDSSKLERAPGAKSKSKRRCEQTSMQLSVSATAGSAPTELQVKKVELFDEGGARLGELTARLPRVWSAAGMYQPWDQKVAPAQQLSVSYVLSQPDWGAVPNRSNKSYVIKAIITVGGSDQKVQRNVEVSAPTSLPANVKT